MTLDDERLAQIRANAAFAVEEFRGLCGAAFGFDAPSVAWVEGYIERMRVRYGDDGVPGGLVSVLGSYLGEAIIASAGGDWVEDEDGRLGVRFASGDTAYPFAKVRKQFDEGLAGAESIAGFYDVSVNFVAKGKLRDAQTGRGEAP